MMKHLPAFLLISFLLSVGSLAAQSDSPITVDPLTRYKYIHTMSELLGSSSPSYARNNEQPTGGYAYSGKGSLCSIVSLRWGRIFLSKGEPGVNILWTGADFNTEDISLIKNNDSYNFLQESFSIPIAYGFRVPLYGHMGKQKFNAIEYTIGPYFKFADIYSLYKGNRVAFFGFAGLFTIGFESDIAFSSLNSQGKGEVFGLRAKVDFYNINPHENEIFNANPLFTSVGIFYNIFNTILR